jgi:hypothetical protein
MSGPSRRAGEPPTRHRQQSREASHNIASCETFQAEGKGVQTTVNSSEKHGISEQDSFKSSFVTDGSQTDDVDGASLRVVAIAWPRLSQKNKQDILAIVRLAFEDNRGGHCAFEEIDND